MGGAAVHYRRLLKQQKMDYYCIDHSNQLYIMLKQMIDKIDKL